MSLTVSGGGGGGTAATNVVGSRHSAPGAGTLGLSGLISRCRSICFSRRIQHLSGVPLFWWRRSRHRWQRLPWQRLPSAFLVESPLPTMRHGSVPRLKDLAWCPRRRTPMRPFCTPPVARSPTRPRDGLRKGHHTGEPDISIVEKYKLHTELLWSDRAKARVVRQECGQVHVELVSRGRTEWIQQLEQRQSQERAASAPPGRGYSQDTAEERTGPPEEQTLEWRNLEPLNDDRDFLFPQGPAEEPCLIDTSTCWHSGPESDKYMAWIRRVIPYIQPPLRHEEPPLLDMQVS